MEIEVPPGHVGVAAPRDVVHVVVWQKGSSGIPRSLAVPRSPSMTVQVLVMLAASALGVRIRGGEEWALHLGGVRLITNYGDINALQHGDVLVLQPAMREVPGIDTMPCDVFCRISAFVCASDVAHVSAVSRGCKEAVSRVKHSLWESFVKRDYPKLYDFQIHTEICSLTERNNSPPSRRADWLSAYRLCYTECLGKTIDDYMALVILAAFTHTPCGAATCRRQAKFCGCKRVHLGTVTRTVSLKDASDKLTTLSIEIENIGCELRGFRSKLGSVDDLDLSIRLVEKSTGKMCLVYEGSVDDDNQDEDDNIYSTFRSFKGILVRCPNLLSSAGFSAMAILDHKCDFKPHKEWSEHESLVSGGVTSSGELSYNITLEFSMVKNDYNVIVDHSMIEVIQHVLHFD